MAKVEYEIIQGVREINATVRSAAFDMFQFCIKDLGLKNPRMQWIREIRNGVRQNPGERIVYDYQVDGLAYYKENRFLISEDLDPDRVREVIAHESRHLYQGEKLKEGCWPLGFDAEFDARAYAADAKQAQRIGCEALARTSKEFYIMSY